MTEVRTVTLRFIPKKPPLVIHCALCRFPVSWEEKVWYKGQEIHRRCKPERPIVKHDQTIRLTHCRYCDKPLKPHKHLYCSGECGWRYKLAIKKQKAEESK